jgi:NADH dehydrogenase/NADH:ubiquinone oxidoreductase subunit G
MLEANALGVMQMGCLPDRGPGFAELKKKGKGYGEMKSGMKALYIAGNVPDSDFKSEFTVVQTSHMTPLAEKADLVLPLSALYEKQGTIMNIYGNQKSFAAAQKPAGAAKDGVEAASEIAAAMSKTKAFTAKDAVASAKKVKPGKAAAGSLTPVAVKAAKAHAVSATALLLAMNQGMLSGSGVVKVLVVKQPALQR